MNILAYDWRLKSESLEQNCQFASDFQEKIRYLKTMRCQAKQGGDFSILQESLSSFYDPYLFTDMEKMVLRLTEAKEKKEKIIIHGDYDVDGVTATAIFMLFLQKLGISCESYIPNRLEEGYGISQSSIEFVLKSGSKLLLTVDCGITAVEELKYLKEKGIDVLLTDHHQPGEVLPDVMALINPSVKSSGYPFPFMCGAMVALKVVHALCQAWHLGEAWKNYLPLASLGTVADVMPLKDENLLLIREGLERLNHLLIKEKTSENIQLSSVETSFYEEHLGLLELFKSYALAKQGNEYFTVQNIAFHLSPRINAAGRMGKADVALQLFLAQTKEEAQKYIALLEELNQKRRDLENEASEKAFELLLEKKDLQNEHILFFYSPGIHPGILGIVAAKLSQNLHKPCLVFSNENEETEKENLALKGSARSFGSVNILSLIREAGEGLLSQVGGHYHAVGLTIPLQNLEMFQRRINCLAEERNIFFERPKLEIDLVLEEKDLQLSHALFLEEQGPYGEGQPEYRFMIRNAYLNHVQSVGNGKHLQLRFHFGHTFSNAYTGIAFQCGILSKILKKGQKIDLVFRMRVNEWRGQKNIQLLIDDIHIQAFCEYPLQENPRVLGLLQSGHPYFSPMLCKEQKKKSFLENFYQAEKHKKLFADFYQYLDAILKSEKMVLIELAELAHHLTWLWDCPYQLELTRRLICIFEEAGILKKFCFSKQPEIYLLRFQSSEDFVQAEKEAFSSDQRKKKVKLSETKAYQSLFKECKDLW